MVVALYVDGMTDAQATQSPHSGAALIYGKVCVYSTHIIMCSLSLALLCT